MNSTTAELLMELDYDSLESGPCAKKDGTLLTVDEMNRVEAASVQDYKQASDNLHIRAQFGQLQAEATRLMAEILKANGMTEKEVTGDVYDRMSEEHKQTFGALSTLAFEAS